MFGVEDHRITVDSLANVRVCQGYCSVWEDSSTVRYQCLLRSNVWNKPINFWNPGHQLGLSAALAEAVESHAGLFRCRKQWWPKLLDTKRSWFVRFCKGCRPFVDEFYTRIFFELHFLLQPWSGSLLKKWLDWNWRFYLATAHFATKKIGTALFQTSSFVLLDSRLIHCDTMQTKFKAFLLGGVVHTTHEIPWNMMKWNAPSQVIRSIAPRTLRECRKAWAAPWNDPSEKSRDWKHMHVSYFHMFYLWSCISSHLLYTADIKTKLDPRVLTFFV